MLYAKAIEFAALTGKETVIDAYCGIGTIGLCAAGRAKQVIGVERNPDAVRNACANAAANKINNARFICADQPIGCALRHSPTLACRTPMLYSWTPRGRAAPPPALMQ